MYERAFLKQTIEERSGRMKKVIRLCSVIALMILSGYILFYGYCYAHPLSLADSFQQLTIYDRNHEVLYTSCFNRSGEWAAYEELPDQLIDAVLSVEDQRFFSHAGIDYIRTAKALFSNLTSSQRQGGSTITQQTAKNLFLTNEQTLTRKIKELFLAGRMEMHCSKENILEAYLNTSYYGHGISGVRNAASFFFGKELHDLTLAECAMLAAIPNGPGIYSPLLYPQQALERRNLVLMMMHENEVIDDASYQKACVEALNLHTNTLSQQAKVNGYYLDAVLNELASLQLDGENVLHVYTGYDPRCQQAMDEALRTHMQDQELQSAMIITQPFSGDILAISGGNNYETSPYNRALYAQRQVASTIKPLLYATALEEGFDPDSTFVSQPTSFTLQDQSVYAPTNYNGSYPNAEISMINAISLSDNIYAMKTHLALGEEKLIDKLRAFGFDQVENNPSLALGTIHMSLSQLSEIYLSFASEGMRAQTHFINEVHSDQQQLYEHEIPQEMILGRNETLMLNQMLRSVFDIRNQSHTLPSMMGYEPRFKMGVKSGTSDFDSLVMGIHPRYVIGVWVGFDDNRILDKQYYALSKQLFQSTMDTLYQQRDDVWYEPGADLEVRSVNPIDGTTQTNGSEYWFRKQK